MTKRSFCVPSLLVVAWLLMGAPCLTTMVEARETTAAGRRSRLIMRVENYLYKSRDVDTTKRNNGQRGRGRKYDDSWKQNGMDDDGGDDDSGNPKHKNTDASGAAAHQNAIPIGEQELQMVLQQDVHEESTTMDDGVAAWAATTTSNNDTSGSSGSNATHFAQLSRKGTTRSSILPLAAVAASARRTLQQWKNDIWESLDDMDKLIATTTIPIAALFSIMPLVAATDIFWVNQLGDTLAVAAQAAGNQIYQSNFWLFSFLPSITAIMVSKSYASDDQEGTQDAICQALMFALVISTCGSAVLFSYPGRFLSSILQEGAPALAMAVPYLRLRSLSFVPMLVSFIGFSAFRGTMDLQSCVKISVVSSAIHVVLNPLLINVFRLGIAGSALTSLFCDWFTAISYVKLMSERGLIVWQKLTKLPAWKKMAPLIRGSLALQVRSLTLNLSQIYVARKIQSLDETGVSTAAFVLAMQTFQVGGVALTALGMATQTLFPNTVESSPVEDRGVFIRALIGRFLKRGFGLGIAVSLVQLLLMPGILKSSPLAEVREAALVPIILVIAGQCLNGVSQVAEGIIMGDGMFARASINLVVSTLGYMACLRECPKSLGIKGVFLCMSVFTLLRLGTSILYLPVICKENDKLDGATTTTFVEDNITTPSLQSRNNQF